MAHGASDLLFVLTALYLLPVHSVCLFPRGQSRKPNSHNPRRCWGITFSLCPILLSVDAPPRGLPVPLHERFRALPGDEARRAFNLPALGCDHTRSEGPKEV